MIHNFLKNSNFQNFLKKYYFNIKIVLNDLDVLFKLLKWI